MKRRGLLVVGLVGLIAAAQAAPKKTATPPPPKELHGQAGKVIDGDTFWFRPDDGTAEVLVRIEGIDAPELCQPWGVESQQALRDHLKQQALLLKPNGFDDFARTLAKVYVGEVDVGDRMVRDGHAWSLRYRSDRGPYVQGERVATTLHRGLHAAGGAQLPRDFRQQNGPCK